VHSLHFFSCTDLWLPMHPGTLPATSLNYARCLHSPFPQVLVHCAHGHGRSATVLCAILISSGEAQDAGDAEALLKAARPRVRLNRRQRAMLEKWMQRRQDTRKAL
jgi:protein-tyrosine phosphatase